MSESTPYRDAGAGGVVYDIATDECEINSEIVRVPRGKLGHGVDGEYVDVSKDDPLPVTPGNARNVFGDVSGVAVSSQATVVSFVADADFRFRGFLATGNADGHFIVQFDGVTVYSRRTNITNPDVALVLPEPDDAAAGTTVTIKVTNEGLGAADFEATLLGV